MPIKVVVVGARSARQGTGPFIADAFSRLGADVCAVVGTSDATVTQARLALKSEQDIECRGYTNLEEALVLEKPDAVAVCSPYPVHAEQLALIASARCHCLVEKPLAWPIDQKDIIEILDTYNARDLLLQLVTQWPQSLSTFTKLHGPLASTITDFTMGLSPISIGPNMIPDSAPHFISMLQALVGPGEFEQVEITVQHSREGEPNTLQLACTYRHKMGRTQAQLQLATCEHRPRPAWYQINGLRVDRQIELPEYRQYLTSETQKAMLTDPLESVVADFLDSLENTALTDTGILLAGHRNLLQLTEAWPDIG
ncbi:MAG: Gfo/Idh/MocA family oxidoreductase [Halioglobus sp.]